MTNNSDKHLFRKIKRGDKLVLELVYKKYYTGLYYYAKKFVGNEVIAKDIVQDCFLKIWENRASISIQTSLSSYLYKTVYNHSLNYLKHEQVNKNHLEQHKKQMEIAKNHFYVASEHGQSILIAKEFNQQIEKAIEDLPDKCKFIFKLSRYEGLKNKEIAFQLNISLNTVQSQISIALKKLRETLASLIDATD